MLARSVGPLVEAALAGVVAGALDLALVQQRAGLAAGELAPAAVVVIGLSVALVTVIGVPVVLLVRLLMRHRAVGAALDHVRERGPRRVEAVATSAAAAVALGIVWWCGFRVVAHVHRTFHDATAAGVLASTIIVGIAVVVGVATVAGTPGVARAIARQAWATRLTSGRVAWGLLLAVLVVVGAVVHLGLRRLAPAWDPVPSYVRLSVPAALVAFAAVGLGRRLGVVRGGVLLGGCAGVVVVALATVGGADRTRGAVLADGAVSTTALRKLQALSDGDGDGFGDHFGGSDCDDGNAEIHPGAPEIVGNGEDDNCLGGDAAESAIAHRLADVPSGDPAAARRDIVLITIDALRADHTSAYGYARDTTPVIAALAARGTRFEHAESPAPLTRRALPSLLYGRYASTLPYREIETGLAEVDDNELPTLASTLRDHGWSTHAILSNHGLIGRPALLGFEAVVTVSHEDVVDASDNAAAVTERAIAWVKEQQAEDRPYFLWVHYIDPHYPYVPSYDEEIAATDAQIGRLLAEVEAAGRGGRTIVAVTADHGEGFGEHGDRFHGQSLYEDQTHVPLVIAVPGGPREVVAAPVSLVDVAPTLLDLVGVAAPRGMNGRSAAAAVRGGGEVEPHAVIAELLRDAQVGRTLLAVWVERWKIVRDLEAWTTQVFEVAEDPEERRVVRGREKVEEMEGVLARAVDAELAALPGGM